MFVHIWSWLAYYSVDAMSVSTIYQHYYDQNQLPRWWLISHVPRVPSITSTTISQHNWLYLDWWKMIWQKRDEDRGHRMIVVIRCSVYLNRSAVDCCDQYRQWRSDMCGVERGAVWTQSVSVTSVVQRRAQHSQSAESGDGGQTSAQWWGAPPQAAAVRQSAVLQHLQTFSDLSQSPHPETEGEWERERSDVQCWTVYICHDNHTAWLCQSQPLFASLASPHLQ